MKKYISFKEIISYAAKHRKNNLKKLTSKKSKEILLKIATKKNNPNNKGYHQIIKTKVSLEGRILEITAEWKDFDISKDTSKCGSIFQCLKAKKSPKETYISFIKVINS
ncbi:hypothetical protein ACFLZV_07490, partial [Candidatus Margulisiibacteriota bacterium]